jgi:hypothetical protein
LGQSKIKARLLDLFTRPHKSFRRGRSLLVGPLFPRLLRFLCHLRFTRFWPITFLACRLGRPPRLVSPLLLRLPSRLVVYPQGPRVPSSLAPPSLNGDARTRLPAFPSFAGYAGVPIPPLAVGSAGAVPPLDPRAQNTGRILPSPSRASPASLDLSAPVLNLGEDEKPLTFKSAIAGPHREQWIVGADTELIKLVETTRTLTPVHTYTSTPTYYNRVVKEREMDPVFSPPPRSLSFSLVGRRSAGAWYRGR